MGPAIYGNFYVIPKVQTVRHVALPGSSNSFVLIVFPLGPSHPLRSSTHEWGKGVVAWKGFGLTPSTGGFLKGKPSYS